MTDSGYRVYTTSRLVQWRFDDFSPPYCRTLDAVQIGIWNWYLQLVTENNRTLFIRLSREMPKFLVDSVPIASFNICVVTLLTRRQILLHKEIRDEQLKYGHKEEFVWKIEVPSSGRFIIDIEFLDLKIASPKDGKSISIWSDGVVRNAATISSLSRMLSENIHTDITICASGGSIGAHRAVLAARSTVFDTMFSHDLKEKKAADKYDVADLKDACQESLTQDINTKNVLERLQFAFLYDLPVLKVCCLEYLVKFGKIFDIREEFDAFIQSGDREMIGEVINEVLSAWKGF